MSEHKLFDQDEEWTYRSVLDRAIYLLRQAGIGHVQTEALWMMEEILQQNRAVILAYPDHTVSSDQVRAIDRFVKRRCNLEPLQYIIGSTIFYKYRFMVTPDVLIPRPETEQVVDYALNHLKRSDWTEPCILDIGTGSGCIAVTLKLEFPHAIVYACDVSEDALQVARRNARSNSADVRFIQADVLSGLNENIRNVKFDMIVSNPPYIPDRERAALDSVVRDHEPDLALFAGSDPLRFYRAILDLVPRLLKPGGRVVFETHADFGTGVAELMADRGFSNLEVMSDWAGLPRIVAGRFNKNDD